MPNHAHILASPQAGANLSTVLGSYESYVTRLSWSYGVSGALWQRSYYDDISVEATTRTAHRRLYFG